MQSAFRFRRVAKPMPSVGVEMAFARHRPLSAALAATLWFGTACSSDPAGPSPDAGPAGTLLVGASIPGSTASLFSFRLDGGMLIPIASGAFANRSRLSPDGLTAYSFRYRPAGQDVYQLIASTQLGGETVLLQFPGASETSIPAGLAIDPTGTRIAMLEVSFASQLYEARIRVYRLGTGGWTDIGTFSGLNGGLDWHPDGRLLLTSLYDYNAGKRGRLAIIDTEGKTLTPIGPAADQVAGDAVFARDGRSIVYNTLNADARDELVSIGFDGRSPTNLPHHFEGSVPVFSPDGRHLSYCANTGTGAERRLRRYLRRIADGVTEEILPPINDYGCVQDWVR